MNQEYYILTTEHQERKDNALNMSWAAKGINDWEGEDSLDKDMQHLCFDLDYNTPLACVHVERGVLRKTWSIQNNKDSTMMQSTVTVPWTRPL